MRFEQAYPPPASHVSIKPTFMLRHIKTTRTIAFYLQFVFNRKLIKNTFESNLENAAFSYFT
jgi:hypothetical protein